MSRFPLHVLLDLSRNRFDEAERRLQQSIAQRDSELQKQAMLENYRNEYQQRLLHAQRKGLSVGLWRDFQSFIGKLDSAFEQQQQAIGRAEELVEAARAHWEETRKKVKAFELLEHRHVVQEEKKEAVREQKLNDEFAAKQHHSKNHG